MSYIVVETVGDEAAAEVLVETLVAHGILAQRRRVPGTPYGPARLEIELRVPPDRLGDARAVLALLAEEAEAAALRETRGAEPAEDELPAWSPAIGRKLPLVAYAVIVTALVTYLFVR